MHSRRPSAPGHMTHPVPHEPRRARQHRPTGNPATPTAADHSGPSPGNGWRRVHGKPEPCSRRPPRHPGHRREDSQGSRPLAQLREKTGDREGAERIAREAVDAADTTALTHLAALWETGTAPNATTQTHTHAGHDHAPSSARLVEEHFRPGAVFT